MFHMRKILAMLLCISLLSGGSMVQTHASSVTSSPIQSRIASRYNKNALPKATLEYKSSIRVQSDEPVISYDEAVIQCRKHLVNRDTEFSMTLDAKYGIDSAKKIVADAMAVTSTTKPNEGDYLYTNWAGGHYGSRTSSTVTVFTFNMEYRASAKQEQEVNQAVKAILDELDVYDADPSVKIKAVYKWMTNNVTYDYTYFKHSSYDALVGKNAVCQGYASSMYRLLRELNVETRYISGIGNGGSHGWNIARIGDFFYNLDATWDTADDNYPAATRYFLLNQEEFTDHYRNAQFATDEFNLHYPMAVNSYDFDKEIELSCKSLNLGAGDTEQLKVFRKNTKEAVTSVKWSSSNKSVVTVDNEGNVKAVGNGRAVITAKTEDGIYVTGCRANVQVGVTSVELSAKSITLGKGKTYTLKVTINPSDAGNKAVTFISSNEAVAKVNVVTGVVTAVGKGTAVITAMTEEGRYEASCTVTVTVPVSSVKLSKTAVTLEKGKTCTLKATVSPSDANNKAVTYTSSNTKVAKVNATTGVVTAVANGTATITVKTKDGAKIAKCTVTVKTSVKSVSLSVKSVKLKKGKTVKLKATVAPSTASNKKVTFKSSNKKIATVTSTGVVKGIKKGTAVITVTTVDGKKTAKCKVIVY